MFAKKQINIVKKKVKLKKMKLVRVIFKMQVI